MDFISMCSKIESEIAAIKKNINSLEIRRISSMMKSLADDEIRLNNCLQEIQLFHRDMFVMPKTENVQADTGTKPTMGGCMQSEYSVIEPGCFKNDPSTSTNNSESSLPREISEVSKILKRNSSSPENDSDGEPCAAAQAASYNIKDVTNDNKYEAVEITVASYYGNSESSSSNSESSSSKSESSSSKSDSDETKDEPTDEEKKWAEKALLDLLANREAGITNLLLHLISKFSCFQRDLRTAEADVSKLGEVFPNGSHVSVKKYLQMLSESVLYLDKTISKIHAKYFEMLVDF